MINKRLDKKMVVRIFMALFGVSLCGFSVGLFKMSMFGTDPFQCFVGGISNILPAISFGTLYTVLNLLMLVCIFLLDRHFIGIATFFNILGVGYIVEFTTKWLSNYFSEVSIFVRIILLIIGIVLMCFASSLYYTADLGVSTYDAISLIITKRRKLKFRYVRITSDLICVAVGMLLHAVVGVGTVITAFFMGPLIEFFNISFSKPLLDRIGSRNKIMNSI